MSLNIKGIFTRKINVSYLILILVIMLFPLTAYPRIYGTDAFQVMWMANAIREGALFSENTWLIHPASYFGYYPFSHRAVGVPIVLAFLINLLTFISFGVFGLTEAILIFDIIIILVLYKCTRNLGATLFKEKWTQFIFVAAILFSPNMINDITMTVSTRVVITIVVIILLDLHFKILKKSIKPFKAIIYIVLLLFIGALAHRLWVGAIITIIFVVITLIIRKYNNFQKIAAFSILPLSIIAFFIGLSVFNVDPGKIWSPFFDNSTLIGLLTNLSIHYALQVGLILLFLPIGVIISIYKIITLLKAKTYKGDIEPLKNGNQEFLRNQMYLLFFILAFSFMAPSFYAKVIFLPILIIFSVYGLIYTKNYLLNVSKKVKWIFPLFLLSLSIGYSLMYVKVYIPVNLSFMFILLFISLFLYLSMVFIYKFRRKILFYSSFDISKLEKYVGVFIIITSMTIFTATSVLGKHRVIDNSPFPWENRYLTKEELEIIAFFRDIKFDGLIFNSGGVSTSRVGGVGFLPVFSDQVYIGMALYYGFISPSEVYENTEFSFSQLTRLRFFQFTKLDPIRAVRNEIIKLNMTQLEDRTVLRFEYHVQYIISKKSNYSESKWTIIQSLFHSDLEPVFSTQHLLVWKIS